MDYKKLSARCGVENCKTRLYYLENGQWFCKNGHRREGDVEVGADNEGFGPKGDMAKKAKKEKVKIRKMWTGKKGFELFIQCYQLILRRQAHWLVTARGFPPELETIVKDLWALRLEKLLTKALHPALADGEDEEAGWSSSQAYSSGYSSYQTNSTGVSSGAESGGSQQGTQRKKKKKKEISQEQRKKRKRRVFARPALIETIGICYLATLMLRAGVSLGDFQRWVDDSSFVYLQAVKDLPSDMREKLDSTYVVTLSPRNSPSPSTLHRVVQTLVHLYEDSFQITFPALNTAVLTTRYMLELGLPPEIYQAVRNISNSLDIVYTFSPPGALKQTAQDWPELRLMAVVIFAARLAWGLDDKLRIPEQDGEISAVSLQSEHWKEYLQLVRGEDAPPHMLTTEKNVLKMSGEEMDLYMDWFERNWAKEPVEVKWVPEAIIDMFPVKREAAENSQAAEKSIHWTLEHLADLQSRSIVMPANIEVNKDGVRPGDSYTRYKRTDDIPQTLSVLVEAAARIIGVEPADVRKVMTTVELETDDWCRKQRAQRRQLKKKTRIPE